MPLTRYEAEPDGFILKWRRRGASARADRPPRFCVLTSCYRIDNNTGNCLVLQGENPSLIGTFPGHSSFPRGKTGQSKIVSKNSSTSAEKPLSATTDQYYILSPGETKCKPFFQKAVKIDIIDDLEEKESVRQDWASLLLG